MVAAAMQMSPQTLGALLNELAQWLEFENCDSVEWVVCGGVAMALQGINLRTTRDVDILGNWNAAALQIACIDDFPEPVKSCIRRVVDNHPELRGLQAKWVNL